MKKKVLLLALCFLFIIQSFGQDLNGYCYVTIDKRTNEYGINTKLENMFKKLGFRIFDLNSKPNDVTIGNALACTYVYYINYNGPSTLTIHLVNAFGQIVYQTSGQGCAFLSASKDMTKCCNSIETQMKGLYYRYDPTKNLSKPYEGLSLKITDELFGDNVNSREYLVQPGRKSLEGIYQNSSGNGDDCTVTIIYYQGRYYGIQNEDGLGAWEVGDIKFVLSPAKNGICSIETYNDVFIKKNSLAKFDGDMVLTYSSEIDNKPTDYIFTKIYPLNEEEEQIPNTNASSLNPRGTGSGVFISGRTLATNYHVIEDSKKIEVLIEKEGLLKTYSAQVICTDKVNDLALLNISDDLFTELPETPFIIQQRTSDVGESIFTMGYPLTQFMGEEVKITNGIISAKTDLIAKAI